MASYNDDYSNKSQAVFEVLIQEGTYKANIDSTWGDAKLADVKYLNDYGEVLQRFIFDMTGKDISILSDWFQLSSLSLTHLPLDIDDDLTAASGNNDFIVKSASGSIKAIVYNDHTTVSPSIMLAANSSTTMAVQPMSSTNEGCIADWELDFTLSFTDSTGMTVAACLSSCTTSYAAVRSAYKCYCVEFKTRIFNLGYMCDLTCPGDGAACGGVSDGYFSVYAGSESNNLDTITAVQENLLTITNATGTSHTITIEDELINRNWTDQILYFDGIGVEALNAAGNFVQYSLHFSTDGTTFTQFLPNSNQFISNGSVVDTSIRLETAIKIIYGETVVSSTVQIYGPPDYSYVDVPYLQIDILFSAPTTTVVTTTAATTTVASVLDASCSNNDDCGNTTNSICENNICACAPGYYANGGRCRRVLGSYCTTIDNCTNQIDNSNCTNNICRCVPGYIRDGVYCAKGVSSGCNNDNECVENGYCNNGKCRCLFGYATVNRRCIPVLGGPCRYTTDCSYVDSNSACLNRKCECLGGYEILGLYCEESGSQIVNIELGMMMTSLFILVKEEEMKSPEVTYKIKISTTQTIGVYKSTFTLQHQQKETRQI
ncbi:hypothetical protein ACF0H5_015798 [Mactra antiquata]